MKQSKSLPVHLNKDPSPSSFVLILNNVRLFWIFVGAILARMVGERFLGRTHNANLLIRAVSVGIPVIIGIGMMVCAYLEGRF